MGKPYFSGMDPTWAVVEMHNDPTFWGTWLALDAGGAQHVMFALENAARRWDVHLRFYVTRTAFDSPDMALSAYVVTARALTQSWQEV